MCSGSWNHLLHMSSMQSGVSNIYSKTSEATSPSYLHPKPPEDLPEVQMCNQEMVRHTNQEMVKHTNKDMVMHTNLEVIEHTNWEMVNNLPLSLSQNSEL